MRVTATVPSVGCWGASHQSTSSALRTPSMVAAEHDREGAMQDGGGPVDRDETSPVSLCKPRTGRWWMGPHDGQRLSRAGLVAYAK